MIDAYNTRLFSDYDSLVSDYDALAMRCKFRFPFTLSFGPSAYHNLTIQISDCRSLGIRRAKNSA